MKLPHRRQFLHLAAGAAALPIVPTLARAQTYPSRPVRIIVAFAPGGTIDITARLMGQWLSERLGQPFIIENRVGAGGNIGTEMVVRSPPDGYTLLQVSTAAAINATLYQNLNFNIVQDITPVAGVIRLPSLMLVNPSVPAKSVPEFIAHAKANPGQLNMGSGGIGSAAHVYGELFKIMAGVDMRHVPYRGEGQALTDLLAGQMHIYFGTTASSIEYVRTGKLRALAVTSASRSPALPDLPTVDEFLAGYEASSWNGIAGPKNMPVEVVEKLNSEINAGLVTPKMKARFDDFGGTALTGTPAEFGKLIAQETEKWAKVVKLSGASAG